MLLQKPSTSVDLLALDTAQILTIRIGTTIQMMQQSIAIAPGIQAVAKSRIVGIYTIQIILYI